LIAPLESMNLGGAPAQTYPAGTDGVDEISAKDIEGLSHAKAATLILSRATSPMTIRQLLAVLERAGRKLSAKNGYGILHKSLRNHKQFDSVAGKWRLVVTPYPASFHERSSERAAG
jgi:hypothetical protein